MLHTVYGEGLLPSFQTADFSLCSYMAFPECIVIWGQGISSSSYKTIHQIRAPLLQPWLALITSSPYPQTQSLWLTSTDEFGGDTIQCIPFCPSIPKLMSLLHATHIYFILTATEVLTDSSTNSIKPEVSSKYHLNQIRVRLAVWFILRQNSSLAVSEPLKSDKLGVSKI